MSAAIKAVEVAGTVDGAGHLVLDEPLTDVGPGRVRLIVLYGEAAEPSERDWLRAASTNPAFDFLRDPAEDIYTAADGMPFILH
jgi:hypothetical protein